VPPEALLHFANSTTVANPGNMSGFNRAWKTQGDDRAAVKVRETIDFLLHGPESLRLEDRFTQLVDGKKGLGFPSFKEPLLTKVLCVVEPDPALAEYRARYQEAFSREGLPSVPPEALLHFANSTTVANPGNMSGFNRAWKTQGDEAAARKVRETIEFLLYGPESLRLEDRFTQLVEGKKGLGFPSFKEPLLTKVLCVVEPDRFLPVVKYSAAADGKKEIAKLVYDLDLPPAAKVSWTIGRLAVWSNDLLRSLVGNDIPDLRLATQFLMWAGRQPVTSRS